MSARLKRLQRLEALRSKASTPFVDPFQQATELFEAIQTNVAAVNAGRAEWVSRPEPAEPETPAMVAAMSFFDRLARRLAAEGELTA
jgi:hypothetical protein